MRRIAQQDGLLKAKGWEICAKVQHLAIAEPRRAGFDFSRFVALSEEGLADAPSATDSRSNWADRTMESANPPLFAALSALRTMDSTRELRQRGTLSESVTLWLQHKAKPVQISQNQGKAEVQAHCERVVTTIWDTWFDDATGIARDTLEPVLPLLILLTPRCAGMSLVSYLTERSALDKPAPQRKSAVQASLLLWDRMENRDAMAAFLLRLLHDRTQIHAALGIALLFNTDWLTDVATQSAVRESDRIALLKAIIGRLSSTPTGNVAAVPMSLRFAPRSRSELRAHLSWLAGNAPQLLTVVLASLLTGAILESGSPSLCKQAKMVLEEPVMRRALTGLTRQGAWIVVSAAAHLCATAGLLNRLPETTEEAISVSLRLAGCVGRLLNAVSGLPAALENALASDNLLLSLEARQSVRLLPSGNTPTDAANPFWESLVFHPVEPDWQTDWTEAVLRQIRYSALSVVRGTLSQSAGQSGTAPAETPLQRDCPILLVLNDTAAEPNPSFPHVVLSEANHLYVAASNDLEAISEFAFAKTRARLTTNRLVLHAGNLVLERKPDGLLGVAAKSADFLVQIGRIALPSQILVSAAFASRAFRESPSLSIALREMGREKTRAAGVSQLYFLSPKTEREPVDVDSVGLPSEPLPPPLIAQPKLPALSYPAPLPKQNIPTLSAAIAPQVSDYEESEERPLFTVLLRGIFALVLIVVIVSTIIWGIQKYQAVESGQEEYNSHARSP